MARLDLVTAHYGQAAELLGQRSSRRIGHNTRLERRHDRTLAVVYHSTAIVRLTPDGTITLHTGGWDTVTTWQRINALLPGGWAVWSHRGHRYLHFGGQRITPYADGLQLRADGSVGFDGATLLTADQVADIRAAGEAAAAAHAARFAARFAARLAAEHETGHPNTYNGRHWRCPTCLAA